MKDKDKKATEEATPSNFIRDMIDRDLKDGKHDGRVTTRFPPEPNGYLHIGHAKAIVVNYGIAEDYKGVYNLRFDDTNPTTEETQYVESIMTDIRWLGYDWGERLYYTSDYFDKLYDMAVDLIKKGRAYVDNMTGEQIREFRGDYHTKAKPSPFRDRPVEENLELFEKMRNGEFKDGECVLRAKVDMDSPNMNMRDPLMYRIRHASHHRTGDKWCIYPMYDWAHGQSDAIEKITHSLCSLEFQNHRPLYDWFTDAIGFEDPPKQTEFARLNLTYTVLSKRRLIQLVEDKIVKSWDDPRMPTLAGLRRRGYTPEVIRKFCDRIGVAKADSLVDVALLEHTLREDLNERSKRVMGVLHPLKVVIENLPEDELIEFDAPYFHEDFSHGSRKVPLTREIYVDRDDYKEDAPKKWHRLTLGKEVRLRYACLITCNEVIKDDAGNVTELRCTWDPASKGGVSPDGRKVRGTLHWVSAKHAIDAEVRLYDRLFAKKNPMDVSEGGDFKDSINPDSLTVIEKAKIEPAMADAPPSSFWQFERVGYFCVDSADSKPGALVFNRTVTLRDSWAKIDKAQKAQVKSSQKDAGKNKEKSKYSTIDDFQKLDLRVGLVQEATLVEGADKLLCLMVDVGEEKPRQIFSGIRKDYPDPSVLKGKQVIVIANLKPRKMRFGMSEGMVLSGGDDGQLCVAGFDRNLKPGAKVG